PRVRDRRLRELRKNSADPGAKQRRGAARRLGGDGAELGAAAEQQAIVGGQAKVEQKVLRVERHAARRQQVGGVPRAQRFGGDNVAADRNDASPERRRQRAGVSVGRNQHVGRRHVAAV